VSLPLNNRQERDKRLLRARAQAILLDKWREWKGQHADKTVLTLADLLSYPTPPMMVDDLIISGSLVNSVSSPGVGKSFNSLDLALSLATGRDTFVGKPLNTYGPSMYVIGEGLGRFNLRVKAWEAFHGVSLKDAPFYSRPKPVALMDDSELTAFIDDVSAIQPKLVVLDTLSRCIPGVNENEASEMARVVNAMDAIRAAVDGDCTVMSLHHLNASGTRERGSTVLRGAVDTQIVLRARKQTAASEGVKDEGDDDDAEAGIGSHTAIGLTTRAPVGKQKDIEELARPIHLNRHEVAVTDSEGNPASSIVWTPGQALSLQDRILIYVRVNPGVSKSDVYKHVGGNRQVCMDAIDAMTPAKLTVVVEGQTHRVYPSV
jgi:hypothetical protein